jgi:release factor glutamine methyltransferase
VALYGGDNGLLHIEAVLDTAVHKLRPQGWLVMEMGLGQEDDVTALVSARPALALRRIRNDLQGIARTYVVQREGH